MRVFNNIHLNFNHFFYTYFFKLFNFCEGKYCVVIIFIRHQRIFVFELKIWFLHQATLCCVKKINDIMAHGSLSEAYLAYKGFLDRGILTIFVAQEGPWSSLWHNYDNNIERIFVNRTTSTYIELK